MSDSDNLLVRVAKQYNRRINELAPIMAASLSPPPGSRKLTSDEELAVWNARDPMVDEQALWQEAAQKIAEAAQMQADERQMALLAAEAYTTVRDAVFPKRRQLIESGRPGIAEQIAYSNRMANRADKAARKEQDNG